MTHKTPSLLKALQEIQARLRYFIDRVFAREFLGQMILIVVLIVLVSLFGVTAMFFGLFSDQNSVVEGIPRGPNPGLGDALWWALGYVIRVEKFAEMYGASPLIVGYALVMSLAGLAVFGLLVSAINNAMQRRIALLQQGDTPVKERGHVLILGWNNRIYSVLRQLARLKPGARVVILDDQDMLDMGEALRLAGIPQLRLTIILRSGVPSNRDELNRVAVDRASAIIALADESDDAGAIKTLVLLAHMNDWPGPRPSMTAEVAREENFELAEIGSRGRLHIVSSSRIISKVIVQTVRNQGLARVYQELMSLEGNSISVQNIAAANSQTLREIAYGFRDGIPLGVTWSEPGGAGVRHKAGLNPEPDYDLADDERLVLLSRKSPTRFRLPAAGFESLVFQQRQFEPARAINVLFMGWSDVIYDILRELDGHVTRGSRVTIMTPKAPADIGPSIAEQASRKLKNIQVSLQSGDPTRRETLQEQGLESYHNLVVLAHQADSEEEPDSRALKILLRLSEHPEYSRVKDRLVVELLDGANRVLFENLQVGDVIVSSDIISAQIAQISQQAVLGSIYRELLSAGGVEIALRPALAYIKRDAECQFDDLIYAAQQNSEIALGLYLENGEVLMNPSRSSTWRLGQGDRLILLAQELYY